MDLWHAYSAVDDEKYVMVVIGPVGEADARSDGQKWSDGYLTEGPHTREAIMLDFITSFDHAPTDSEKFFLVPDKYRDSYIQGLAEDLLASQEFQPNFELNEAEIASLSLSLKFRVPQLQEIIDRYVISGMTLSGNDDRRIIQAASDQIEALISVANKLGLTDSVWNI